MRVPRIGRNGDRWALFGSRPRHADPTVLPICASIRRKNLAYMHFRNGEFAQAAECALDAGLDTYLEMGEFSPEMVALYLLAKVLHTGVVGEEKIDLLLLADEPGKTDDAEQIITYRLLVSYFLAALAICEKGDHDRAPWFAAAAARYLRALILSKQDTEQDQRDFKALHAKYRPSATRDLLDKKGFYRKRSRKERFHRKPPSSETDKHSIVYESKGAKRVSHPYVCYVTRRSRPDCEELTKRYTHRDNTGFFYPPWIGVEPFVLYVSLPGVRTSGDVPDPSFSQMIELFELTWAALVDLYPNHTPEFVRENAGFIFSVYSTTRRDYAYWYIFSYPAEAGLRHYCVQEISREIAELLVGDSVSRHVDEH